MPEPLVEEDFDTWAARQGVSPFPPSEPGLHRYPKRPSRAAERAAYKYMAKVWAEWQTQRDVLRKQYNEKVAAGEIVPPKRIDKLRATAKGHPDNPSVQAARRILINRYGYDPKFEEYK